MLFTILTDSYALKVCIRVMHIQLRALYILTCIYYNSGKIINFPYFNILYIENLNYGWEVE